jgi:2-keto-4-pentenoate hydratase/2-oxohepta-3-ene-1,7-dioic acid hydratase in catechol pathway
MIHSVAEILEFLKEWYDLNPGDLVWTGTPKGVGAMKIGDEVKAEMRNSDSEIISKFYAVCQ